MDDSFFAYLQLLELMGFFSGYPLLYAVVLVIGKGHLKENDLRGRMVSLLPFAYALVGTLYLGLQLRNMYPNYSPDAIRSSIYQPWLVTWGLLSILFWIPAIAKKKVLTLLHSLVFFFFLAKDLFLQVSGATSDKNILRNDMKIYTTSLLINLGAFVAIVIIYLVFSFYRNRYKTRARQ